MLRTSLGLFVAAALLLAGVPGSCIEFDGQLVLARRDAERDRLDALFVYRNLHATHEDLTRALQQSERLHSGARWVALLELLDRSVEVVPGRIWTDAEDGLCAWQLVRVRHLAAVTEAANVALREVLLADDAHELRDIEHAETVQIIEILARNEWSLAWQPGAIVARLGHPSQGELRLQIPPRGKTQEGSLVEAFRQRGWEVADEDLDGAALAAFTAWLAAD